MDVLQTLLAIVHLAAAAAWLGGMIFHIVVLDPVFRKNEVSLQSAFLLALMERRFRRLVGASIVLLVGSGLARAWLLFGSSPGRWPASAARYLVLKMALTAGMLVIFAVCPKTRSCSPVPGACDAAAAARLEGGEGTLRARSKAILPRVALGLGLAALAAGALLRG